MKAAEYSKLRRIFFGTTSARYATRILLDWKPSGEPMPWTKIIYEVASKLRIPFREVYAMTMTEVACVRRDGEPSHNDSLHRSRDDETLSQAQERIIRRLHGMSPEEFFARQSKS